MSNITTITPIVQGMKGSVVSQVLNANFQNILNELKTLKAENELLKKTAMIGNNGNGGVTEDAVVNIMYDPQTIMAKTSDTDEYYTVNVKVMCGNKEVFVGDADSVENNTYKVDWDKKIVTGGLTCSIDKLEGKNLSFRVTVNKNSIADGSFEFHVTFRGVTYNSRVNIISTTKDSTFDYAQGIFVSTIFTRSDSTPAKPEGGTYSIPLPTTLDGDPKGQHQGWSDGIPSGTKPLYTCHRKFTSNGQKPQEATWSTPLLAMDSADLDVCFTNWSNGTPQPPAGDKGINQDTVTQPYGWHNNGKPDDIWMATCVKKGNEWGNWSIVKVKGENGTSSDWKNTIYKMSNSQPLRPTADTIDFVDNDEAESPNDGWHDVPNDNGTWWMSSAYVDGDTKHVQKEDGEESGWSEPVKVTAGSSQAVFVSTVFKRAASNPGKPLDPGDFNEPVPSGWSDGIPADTTHTNYPVWQTHKKFTSDNLFPQDEDWSEPVLMMDTADFDCCFCYYTGSGAPGNPNDNQGSDDGSGYHWHEPEYATSDDNWMATRYKAANAQWGSWVITRIKGESGNDGNYTNYIFKASSASTLDAPNILDPRKFIDKPNDQIKDDNGNPNSQECNQGWVDGPGVGDIWWMSCAVIDGTTGQALEKWSTPTKLTGDKGTDGSYTEYKYAINTSEVDPPTNISIDQWDDSVSGALHTLSVAEGKQEDYRSVPSLHYMWMAMRRHYIPEGQTELVIGNWDYARVTGEKGEDGTKLKVNGTKDSYEELFLLSVDSSNRRRSQLPNDGDSYIVNQEMWVWSESADWVSGDSTTLEAYNTNLDPARWQNCGGIVGPAGESQYLHILYADNLDVEIKDENEQVIGHCPSVAYASPEGCRYMGTLVDNQIESPNNDESLKLYTWSKFTGADGYGYEYIYKLSDVVDPYKVPLSADCKDYWYKETVNGTIYSYTVNAPDDTYKKKTFQDNDYIPSGWTDNPSGITEEYPFEFMCKRVRQDGKWGEFTGQAGDNTSAILYSYKGKDAPYQRREWAVFDAFVWKAEMATSNTWGNTIPNPDEYLGKCLWQREKTVTPVNGSAPDEVEDEWHYLRISGEKGNEGTSLNVKGTYDSLNQLFLLAYKDNSYTAQGGIYDASNLKSGDAYTVSGHMWTWNASNDYITTSPSAYDTLTPQTHWRDAGEIVGPAGESQYIHIKYANTVSACTEEGKIVYKVLENEWLTSWISDHDGELPGPFMGICITNSETDPDVNLEPDNQNYKWSKYQGEDGIDYEMIYTRTSGRTEPDDTEHEGVLVPLIVNDNYYSGTSEGYKMYCASPEAGFNSNGSPKNDNVKKLFQSEDFIPTTKTQELRGGVLKSITTHNWTDNPMGPTEELPYEWACRRDKIKGVWTNFYGRADDTEYAFLYNKWGKSTLDININCGQNFIFKREGNTAAIQTQVIEFTLSKDNMVQTLDGLSASTVVEKASFNGTVTEENFTNFFNTPIVKPSGDQDCHNPYISLTTKKFTLETGCTYSFNVVLNKDNVDYVKKFTFTLEAKDGNDGAPLVQYKIVADKPNLVFDARGQLDMDANDGIAVSCYVMSATTETEIDWSSDRRGYQMCYQVDSQQKQNMNTDNRTGHYGAFVPKSMLNTVTKEVTITLESGSTPSNRIICQTIKIPVLYDVGSRDNLFSKDNGIDFMSVATSEGKYAHAIHNNNGFTAVMTSMAINERKTMGLIIQDNPNNPHFEQGKCYCMTGDVRINYISGNTTYNNEDVCLSGFTCAKGEEKTESKRQYFTEGSGINVNNLVASNEQVIENVNGKVSRKWSDWYHFEWRTSGYTDCPQICFSRNLTESTRSTLYVDVRNLKIEQLARKTDKPTPFNGLGETTSLSMTRPNLFEKSGVFADPFLVYWDNENHNPGIGASSVRSGITCTTIPYGYCGNTVLEICDSGATPNYNRWGSFMVYMAKVQKGQYYTVSWYQRTKPGNTNPEEQPMRLSITNGDNLVPKLWTICGSGSQIAFGNKNSGSNTMGMDFAMTKDWTRQYMTFYYMPSGNTQTTAKLYFDWYYRNTSLSINKSIQMTMPKLEIGDFPTTWQQNDTDRIGKPLRGPSAWESGATYEGGGPNDNFQDLVTYGNSSNMYLCKVTHTATVDNNPGSHSIDRAWDVNDPWQVTEKKDFIAAEVIYTDKLATAVLQAVNARINELTVQQLKTTNVNGASVDIENGTIRVFGQNKSTPNIVFGVNKNGDAVLTYYNNNGEKMYDLGPSGISQLLSTVNPQRTEVSMTYLPPYYVNGINKCPLLTYINSLRCYNLDQSRTYKNDFVKELLVGGDESTPVTFYEFMDGEMEIKDENTNGITTKYFCDINGVTDSSLRFSGHTPFHGRLFVDSACTIPVHNRILCTYTDWKINGYNKGRYETQEKAPEFEAVYYLEGLPAIRFNFAAVNNTIEYSLPVDKIRIFGDKWYLYTVDWATPDKQIMVELNERNVGKRNEYMGMSWKEYNVKNLMNYYTFPYSDETLLNKYNLKYTSVYGKLLLYNDESYESVYTLTDSHISQSNRWNHENMTINLIQNN